MKRLIAIGVILLFIGMTVSSSGFDVEKQSTIASLDGNTLYVDDDNTEGPWDGTEEHPYQHIMDAVNHVNNGDTIFVFNGTYNEDLDIDFDSYIAFNLTGENKHDTHINGNIKLYYTKAVVRISEFTIENSVKIWSGTEDNNVVTNCIFVSGGVRLIESSYSKVINNTFLSDYTLMQESSHNTITGNDFTSGGIFIVRTSYERNWNTHTIENNTMNGKPIRYYKNSNGISVPSDTAQLILSHCNNFTINNLIISNVEYGIQLAYSSDNFISDCIITNASSMGSSKYRPTGIDLQRSYSNEISNIEIINFFIGIDCDISGDNTIANSTILGGAVGIQIFDRPNNAIYRNLIENNSDYGIAQYLGFGTIIDGNVISNNRCGILFYDAVKSTVSNNQISSNSEYGFNVRLGVFNKVIKNNFIDNECDAHFYSSATHWFRNYWNRPRTFPKIIKGTIELFGFWNIFYILTGIGPEPPEERTTQWYNVDWRPAQEPYDIGV